MRYFFFCWMTFLCALPDLQAQQFFEGVVHYHHIIEAKDSTANEFLLINFYGNSSKFYFKEGNYRWDFQESELEYQVYNQKENKVFDKYHKNDTLYWTAASEQIEDLVQDFAPKASSGQILDLPMMVYNVKSQFFYNEEVRGRMYYFSPKYALNPAWFKQHKLNNLDAIYARTKAIPLRIVVLYPNYRVTYLAIKVEAKPLDKSLFEINKKATLKQVKGL